MTKQRTRIQNELMSVAKAFDFVTAAYDDAGAASASDTDTVNPETAFANEIASVYEQDPKYMIGVRRKKTNWRFILILKFNVEVILEDFEDYLRENPPRLDKDGDLPPVRLDIENVEVDHPVTQTPGRGTEAKIEFTAWQGRQ